MFPNLRPFLCLLAIVLFSGAVSADVVRPLDGGVNDAQRDPAALLARASEALGGTALVRDLPGFRIVIQGGAVSPSNVQARDPKATHNVLLVEREYVLDIAGQRGRRVSSQVSPGPIRFYTLAVATRESARTVDLLKWRSGTDIQNQPSAVGKAAVTAWTRMTPHGAVHQALKASGTLKDGGQVERDGRMLDAITYADPNGTTVTLYLESATGLPFSVTPAEGPNTLWEFGDYTKKDGIQVPQRMAVRSAGLLEELRITTFDLKPSFDTAFELPAGYSDPPPLGEPRAVKVAEGVYRLDGMPQNYHSAFVVDGNDVSVFDAPVSPQYSEIAMKVIRATVGEQARFARVLISHHHGDHTGGFVPYVTAGATIVCGPGVDDFLRTRVPEAQRAAATFEVVTSTKTFGTGKQRIEAHLIPNEHSVGNVAYFLPEHKVLLQGDLFYVPERGPVPPAFSVTLDLANAIAAKKLDVRTIIGVHGRQGTVAELRESIAQRR